MKGIGACLEVECYSVLPSESLMASSFELVVEVGLSEDHTLACVRCSDSIVDWPGGECNTQLLLDICLIQLGTEDEAAELGLSRSCLRQRFGFRYTEEVYVVRFFAC